MPSDNSTAVGDRERTWRRRLKYGFRAAVACGLAGLLLGLTVPDGISSDSPYPLRAYVAAVLAIIGVVGGGAIVIVSFILNAINVGRRVRNAR
jgi:hypothetical protein